MVAVSSPPSLYYIFIILKKYLLSNLSKPMQGILLGSADTLMNKSAKVPAPLEFIA